MLGKPYRFVGARGDSQRRSAARRLPTRGAAGGKGVVGSRAAGSKAAAGSEAAAGRAAARRRGSERWTDALSAKALFAVQAMKKHARVYIHVLINVQCHIVCNILAEVGGALRSINPRVFFKGGRLPNNRWLEGKGQPAWRGEGRGPAS